MALYFFYLKDTGRFTGSGRGEADHVFTLGEVQAMAAQVALDLGQPVENIFIHGPIEHGFEPEKHKLVGDEITPDPFWDWPTDLAEAKFKAQGLLLADVQKFGSSKPSGLPRYDADLKANLLNAAVVSLAGGGGIPAPVAAVQTWQQALLAAYFERKAALAGAQDMAALMAVDASREWFEARFGVSGSVHPDPDISTADLV